MGEQLLRVRTSERTQFADCRMAWYWSYVDRLTPLRQPVYFTFGDIFHQALALNLIPEKPRGINNKAKRGMPLPEAFVKVYDDVIGEGQKLGMYLDGEWDDARDLGIHMAENYVERYGDDRRYRVVAPEMPFQIRLKDADGRWYLYVGQTDGVIQDLTTGQYGLIEHKTWARDMSAGLHRSEQAASYWAFTPVVLQREGLLDPGVDLTFMLYNVLFKRRKDDKREKNAEGLYLNKNGTVSKNQGTALFHREIQLRTPYERVSLHHRAAQQVKEMRLIREGKLAPIKSPGEKCGRCPHRDMCELHEAGADWEEFRDVHYFKWEPYEAHEHKAG
jgi:hypothetical protein